LTSSKTANQNFCCLHDPWYANFRKKSRKCQQNKNEITGYDIFSRHLRPNLQLEGTRSGIVHGCSELKLNENSEQDKVVMYQNMLHS